MLRWDYLCSHKEWEKKDGVNGNLIFNGQVSALHDWSWGVLDFFSSFLNRVLSRFLG